MYRGVKGGRGVFEYFLIKSFLFYMDEELGIFLREERKDEHLSIQKNE